MKCAVSDFDRTLYVERMISDEDKNAVINWQKSGNLFVIATGRNLGTLFLSLMAFRRIFGS